MITDSETIQIDTYEKEASLVDILCSQILPTTTAAIILWSLPPSKQRQGAASHVWEVGARGGDLLTPVVPLTCFWSTSPSFVCSSANSILIVSIQILRCSNVESFTGIRLPRQFGISERWKNGWKTILAPCQVVEKLLQG